MRNLTKSVQAGVLLAALAALVLAGCGGGADSGSAVASSSSEATSPTSPTKSEFIAEADAVCEEADVRQAAKYKAYARGHAPAEEESKSGEEAIVDEVGLPAIAIELKELEDLPVPAGENGEVGAILEGAEEALKSAEASPLSVLDEATDPFNEVEKLAKKYGFKSCGIQ